MYLVSNPGSNSRKYSIYSDMEEILKFLFDPIETPPKCYITDKNGKETVFRGYFEKLADSGRALKKILLEHYSSIEISMILIRIVATADYFMRDHIVDDECIEMLKRDSARTPLHAPITLAEIYALREAFPDTKIALISDSSFHACRPDVSKYYAIDMDLADEFQIKRYGAHGLSMESIVKQMKERNILPEKLVVCHIGSGVSVSAIKNGESFETTMGYTPLEGVAMATRSGDIDPAAVFAIKRILNLSDEETEKYLNQKCGLLGLGRFNDFRDINARREIDTKCAFAYNKFIYRIQQEIGKMAASMSGIDALVFTATIGERQASLRKDLVDTIGFLGFKIDDDRNEAYHYSQKVGLVSKDGSKPVYAILTNETAEMLAHAKNLL